MEDCVVLDDALVLLGRLERENQVGFVLLGNYGSRGEEQKPVKHYFLQHFVGRRVGSSWLFGPRGRPAEHPPDKVHWVIFLFVSLDLIWFINCNLPSFNFLTIF